MIFDTIVLLKIDFWKKVLKIEVWFLYVFQVFFQDLSNGANFKLIGQL